MRTFTHGCVIVAVLSATTIATEVRADTGSGDDGYQVYVRPGYALRADGTSGPGFLAGGQVEFGEGEMIRYAGEFELGGFTGLVNEQGESRSELVSTVGLALRWGFGDGFRPYVEASPSLTFYNIVALNLGAQAGAGVIFGDTIDLGIRYRYIWSVFSENHPNQSLVMGSLGVHF